jgi:hypothetical protein
MICQAGRHPKTTLQFFRAATIGVKISALGEALLADWITICREATEWQRIKDLKKSRDGVLYSAPRSAVRVS